MNEPPLYTFEAAGMRVLRNVLLLLASITLVVCASLVAMEPDALTGAAVTAISLLLTYAFIWAILPTRYELSRTHLGLVFPWKTWHVGLDTVEWMRPGNWWEAYGYFGMRFTTNPGQSVVIRRKQPNLLTRPNLVISPADREDFLRAVESLGTGTQVGSIH